MYDLTQTTIYAIINGKGENIMGSFEKFTKRRLKVEGPRIGLQNRGNFSLNHAAYQLMGEPALIALLYDEEGRRIGFQPTNKDDASAYPVRKQKAAQSYIVSGRAFCRYYRITFGDGVQYFTPRLEGDTLVLDLAE